MRRSSSLLPQEKIFKRLNRPIEKNLNDINHRLLSYSLDDLGSLDSKVLVEVAMFSIRKAALQSSQTLLHRNIIGRTTNEERQISKIRADINQSLRCFEAIYENSPLATLAEAQARIAALTKYPEAARYRDLRVVGLQIELLEKSFPPKDPKSQLAIFSLKNRHAIMMRNSIVLQNIQSQLGQNNKVAEMRRSQINLALKMLKERIDSNRTRYEHSRSVSDMQTALRFCEGIIPILLILQKNDNVEQFRKKMKLWERLLNDSQKK